jgi:stage II sporulation protein D
MDPQTARIRAVVNPRLAFEQAYPPGSTIKTFTELSALRAGVLDAESRIKCAGRYTSGDYQITCSHPRSKSAFSPAQALAHSCNCFFATVAERLSPSAFSSTLSSFGFGKRTGMSAAESDGTVPGDNWHTRDAVGEGKDITVTAIQLLTAYAALLNGGRVYRPQQVEAGTFTEDKQRTLAIDPGHRRMLIEGMRAAVEYGTARESGLANLPLFVFGKTGTSAASNGFRRQGWFAGLAADLGSGLDAPPEAIRLGVVVFIKRGHGSECAAVSRRIFEAYVQETRNRQSALNRQSVRVRDVREGRTTVVPLEDYVLGVLAAEGATEDQVEALKALAVVSRTYALRNLGRHEAEGYDFCTLTHCQVYRNPPGVSQAAREAAASTEGESLRDQADRVADVYFSAACGGVTADVERLWGGPARSYLRPVADDYCATMPNRNWMEEIPGARLLEALGKDPRSDVGRRLDRVDVIRRDATGRAELIALEGERRRQLPGWDFKLIVGRGLGWNVLKSSRFDLSRRGSAFVFRGSGFGHGVGLCQSGAHVMARRGADYRAILRHYFPGLIEPGRDSAREEDGLPQRARRYAEVAQRVLTGLLYSAISAEAAVGASDRASNSRVTISSEHFRVTYPRTTSRAAGESALRTLEAARADILRRLAAASLDLAGEQRVEVIIHASTQDFMAATDQPWWVAGASRQRRIHLQPVNVLRKRGILASTLRHEYTHVVVEALGGGRVPRWLAEGLAIHVAGEGPALKGVTAISIDSSELEQRLESPRSASEFRALYLTAYLHVVRLIKSNGESHVWQQVASNQWSGM